MKLSNQSKFLIGLSLMVIIAIIILLLLGKGNNHKNHVLKKSKDTSQAKNTSGLTDAQINDTSMRGRHDYYAICSEINDGRIYISAPNAKVYNSDDQTQTISILNPGDTVKMVENPESFSDIYCSDSFYEIKFLAVNQIKTGFIKGKPLGRGGQSGLNSGLMVVHYSSYNNKVDEDGYPSQDEGNAELVLIRNHRVICKLPYMAYSEMGIYKFKIGRAHV